MKALAIGAAAAALLSPAHGASEYMKQNVRKNFGEHRMVALPIDGLHEEAAHALHKHGFDDFGHADGHMHMRLHPNAARELEEMGVPMRDFTEEFLTRTEQKLNSPGFFCEEDAASCARKTADDFYASYQELDALYARVEGLVAQHTDIASMDTIGNSYEGRDMKIVKIGDESKPLVLWACGVHSREWLTQMLCTYIIEQILTNPADTALLDKFSFTILLSLNPDGFVYTHTVSNFWRKTRFDNPGTLCDGIDGNRDYSVMFAGPGSSTDPCDETYPGHHPFEAIEIANLRDYAYSVQDRLFTTNDVHSFGQLWMSPWAGTYELPPEIDFDRMQTCNAAAAAGIKSVNGLDFAYGSVANTIYIAAGGAVDWFYAELGVIYAYTLEARSGGFDGLEGFQPPPENIMPSNMELFQGMKSSILCAYDLEFGAPTAFPTGSPFECVDMDPNGITYIDGTPAPCDEIAAYCQAYDFVAQRCHKTCNTCQTATAGKLSDAADVTNVMTLPAQKIGGVVVSVYVLVGVAAAVVGMFVAFAAVVAVRKYKSAAQETPAQSIVAADI